MTRPAVHPHRRADGAARVRRVEDPDGSDVRSPRAARTASAGGRRRARSAARRSSSTTSAPSTRCCSPTSTTPTTSTRPGRTFLPGAGVVITTVSGARRLGAQRSRARRRGTRRGWNARRPPDDRRSRRRRAATVRRDRTRSSVTSSASRSTWEGQEHGRSGSRATRSSTTVCARSPIASTSARR